MDNLKRLVALWQLLATNTQLSHFVSEKDREVFSTRAEGEGLPFLTTVLPRLFKALDSAMQSSTLGPVEGFQSRKGEAYPVFLRKAWEAVFEKDGSLKPTSLVQTGAIVCIRQLSAVYYKLELPHTEEQVNTVITAFLQAEDDLGQLDLMGTGPAALLGRARNIVGRLLSGSNPFDIQPRHGSGASACRVKPVDRYSSFRYIDRLNRSYPYDEYFFSGKHDLCDNMDRLFNAEEAEPEARVVMVHKDSRGPRLISCEPREFMYIQQGLMAKLYDAIDHHPTIARMVSCTDQTRNQELAREASIRDHLATLDLKEASDRVSWELVCTMFPQSWIRAFDSCRTRSTVLPDGTSVPLDKFAPMGSACCFPVEAICFWAIVLAATYSKEAINRIFANRPRETDMQMSVFGDDIIVASENSDAAVGALESVGLLVNKDKSFRTGPFRESCGGDYYFGSYVAPVRLKSLPTNDKRGQARTCDVLNNIMARYGLQDTEVACHDLYKSWYGEPVVTSKFRLDRQHDIVTCSIEHDGLCLIGSYTSVPKRTRKRTNGALQRREYLCLCEHPIYNDVELNDWSHILRRGLLNLGDRTASRYALARRVRYKYSWVCL